MQGGIGSGEMAAGRSGSFIRHVHPGVLASPRFSSGKLIASSDRFDAFWRDLFSDGAEIVLNGHLHAYERFAPQTPDQEPDANGIREFIVGTGGENYQTFDPVPELNSEVRKARVFGILELTLHAASYDWRFVPNDGETFADSGSGTCH